MKPTAGTASRSKDSRMPSIVLFWTEVVFYVVNVIAFYGFLILPIGLNIRSRCDGMRGACCLLSDRAALCCSLVVAYRLCAQNSMVLNLSGPSGLPSGPLRWAMARFQVFSSSADAGHGRIFRDE